jgi:protein TonB
VYENRIEKLVGLVLVVAIHVALLYVAMSYKLIPPPQEALTLMVNLIKPPPPKEEPPPEPPKPPPPKEVKLIKKQKPIELPKPAPVLVAEAPVVAPTEPVAPPPPPEPIQETPPPEPVVEAPPPKPAAPVQITGDMLQCSQKSEPNYPPASRRMGEQGSVKLRLELDETGHITSAKVIESSGHTRLDNAGLATVKNWRCQAATRDGQPVRAVALQTFDFILEGN